MQQRFGIKQRIFEQRLGSHALVTHNLNAANLI